MRALKVEKLVASPFSKNRGSLPQLFHERKSVKAICPYGFFLILLAREIIWLYGGYAFVSGLFAYSCS